MGRVRSLVLVGAVALVATGLSGCQIFPGSPEFVVTTTVDGADADPGDGICEVTVGADDCSLRAAITEANASSVAASVSVPAATYALTSAGTDDTNAGGDLDIAPVAGAMVIAGASGNGFAVDATGANGGLDIRSGNIAFFAIGVQDATGDGVVVRSGALGAFTFASVHDNTGAGVRVEAGGRSQLWTTTVSGNGAGGVANQGLTTTKFATIADNVGGGFTGVGNDSATAGIHLDSTLVVNQAAGSDCADGVLTATFSSAKDPSCFPASPENFLVSTSVLGPLGGGLVPVHPLVYSGSVNVASDSVPLGSGSCIVGSPLMTDQVGTARPRGGACDRGAYEGPGPLNLFVTSAADERDADPGDGICATASASCTLRAAIDEANAWPSVDTVSIVPDVDPQLTLAGAGEDANASGDLDITDALTIVGLGTNTISSTVADRLLDHHAGLGPLHLTDLHLSGGDASGDVRGGGALVSDGTLTVERVTSDAAVGSSVGAIAHEGDAAVTLTDVTVTGATGSLAAVRSHPGVLDGVTISGTVGGAGLAIERGRITDSSFIDNGGSGIVATSVTSDSFINDLDITGTTIAGNVSGTAGGGILVQPSAAVYLDNSTISGNAAPVGAAVFIEPPTGAVPAAGSFAALQTTIVANDGATSLVGQYLNLAQSAVSAGSGTLCAAGITSNGYNITTDASCGLGDPTDQVVADLALGPLANNGGPTLTHLPTLASPVVDVADPGAGARPCTAGVPDQRGVERPQGLACDVGSVELEVGVGGIIVVDSATDAVDAAPGDGVCRTAAAACTLRAAVEESNRSLPVETIAIAAGVDPVLSIVGRGEDDNVTGDLDVAASVVIDGGGATVSGNGVDRILDSRSTVGIVQLRNLTLRDGDASSGPGAGAGAIAAAGGLRTSGITVVDNIGSGVGAIDVAAVVPAPGTVPETSRTVLEGTEVGGNSGGPAVRFDNGFAELTDVDVHDNDGGGVRMVGQRLVLTRAHVHANASAEGGGIWFNGSSTSVIDSWIEGNTSSGLGGGLFVSGQLGIEGSTISGNAAVLGGGGVWSTQIDLRRSTISGNQAPGAPGGGFVASSSATVSGSTIAGNIGLTSVAASSPFIVESIVVAGSGSACSAGAFNSDYNVFGDASCGATATSIVSATPGLGPLQDNGGATPTHLLLVTSPARNAISMSATVGPIGIPVTFPACPLDIVGNQIDQRGVGRPQGGACDIGATEQ